MQNTTLMNEIKMTREKLHTFIDKYGIDDKSQLADINNKLDELIVKWVKAYC